MENKWYKIQVTPIEEGVSHTFNVQTHDYRMDNGAVSTQPRTIHMAKVIVLNKTIEYIFKTDASKLDKLMENGYDRNEVDE